MAYEIVGRGLAGSCLAWHLSWRGLDFRTLDDGRRGSASPVAAGLVNPVTGRNFEPSWRLAEFLPEMTEFYRKVGEELGLQLWFPMPVVRLVTEREWGKVARKIGLPEVGRWVGGVEERVGDWRAAVTLVGGGRVDVKAFCRGTAARFAEGASGSRPWGDAVERVRCDGAFGLMGGAMGEHRCAKGEILTVRIPGADASRILIGGGGWLVPLGGGLFKAGSTYDWERLDGEPTESGRRRIGEILDRLGVGDWEPVGHEAGIRPIVRRSMPLIGRLPDGSVGFNGLGSKGSLYAPGVSRQLAGWLAGEGGIEDDLDVARWLARE